MLSLTCWLSHIFSANSDYLKVQFIKNGCKSSNSSILLDSNSSILLEAVLYLILVRYQIILIALKLPESFDFVKWNRVWDMKALNTCDRCLKKKKKKSFFFSHTWKLLACFCDKAACWVFYSIINAAIAIYESMNHWLSFHSTLASDLLWEKMAYKPR